MKRMAITLVCVFALTTSATVWGAADDAVAQRPVNAGNTVCPVMKTKVVPGKALTVAYNGKLYNVCCPVCVGEFKRDPAKYATVAEQSLSKTNP